MGSFNGVRPTSAYLMLILSLSSLQLIHPDLVLLTFCGALALSHDQVCGCVISSDTVQFAIDTICLESVSWLCMMGEI